jgi:hypothetical protein
MNTDAHDAKRMAEFFRSKCSEFGVMVWNWVPRCKRESYQTRDNTNVNPATIEVMNEQSETKIFQQPCVCHYCNLCGRSFVEEEVSVVSALHQTWIDIPSFRSMVTRFHTINALREGLQTHQLRAGMNFTT